MKNATYEAFYVQSANGKGRRMTLPFHPLLKSFCAGLFLLLFSMSTVSGQCGCNNQINIGIPDNGSFFLRVSHVIAGDEFPGPCQDESQSYTLRIIDPLGGDTVVSNPIDCRYVGQTLMAEVYDDTEQVCWGSVLVEDKLPPEIQCAENFQVGCNTDYTPGADPRRTTFRWVGARDFSQSFEDIPISTEGLPSDAIITDINLSVDITHSSAGDVRIRLFAPNGFMPAAILQSDPSCTGPNIDITLDDEAGPISCDNMGDPALAGEGAPNMTPLSVFDGRSGSDAVGIWTVRVHDVEDNGISDGIAHEILLDIEFTSPALTPPVPVDNCSDVAVSHTDVGSLGLCNEGIITRIWTATDAGGMSTSCEQEITVFRDTSMRPAILWPNDTVFSCTSGYTPDQLDPDFMAQFNNDSAFYDEPRYFPEDHDYCGNLQIGREPDLVYDIDDCGDEAFKIRREWVVIDWCDPAFEERHIQVISVKDTMPPDIMCSGDMTVSVDGTCMADLTGLGGATATDSCDGSPEISELVLDANGIPVPDPTEVGLGSYMIEYTAMDNCGNEASCRINVEVVDSIAPTCIAGDDVITLSDTIAELPVAELDEGSSDNCTDVQFLGRRMDEPNAPFTDTLTFTCDDRCDTIMVIFRVCDDQNGNGEVDPEDNCTDCMVEVEVQDKTPPTIMGAEDVTIQCESDIPTADSLTVTDNCDPMPTLELLGDDTLQMACPLEINRTWQATDDCDNITSIVQNILVNDTIPPTLSDPGPDMTVYCDTDPFGEFGDVSASDNCGGIVTIGTNDVEDPYNCDGYNITRTWTAEDECGNSSTTSQTLTVIDTVPPTITCPDNITIMADCDTDSAVVSGFIATATDLCSPDVSCTNDSEGAGVDTMSCDASGTYPVGVHTITFIADDGCGNTDTCMATITVEPEPVVAMCVDTIREAVNSQGFVVIPAEDLDNGSTGCDPLTFNASRDTFFCDDIGSPVMDSLFVEGANGEMDTCVTIVIIEDLTSPTVMCNPLTNVYLDENGLLTIDSMLLVDTAFDNCDNMLEYTFDPTEVTCADVGMMVTLEAMAMDDSGNDATCSRNVTVRDTFPPELTCRSDTQTITLDTTFFVLNPDSMYTDVMDNCVDSVTIDIMPDTVFCDDIGLDTVTVIATDQGGNSDTCMTIIMVEEGMGNPCPSNLVLSVSGLITNGFGVPVSQVQISNTLDDNMSMTDQTGQFKMDSIPVGSSLDLMPAKDEHPVAGVTTLDIVMIRRHILGLHEFDSPYKIIAADINNSGSVTSFDMSLLRRVILGLDDEFTNNSSWRFVDGRYQFPDQKNPFTAPFPENYELRQLTTTVDDVEIVGIKVGDVNPPSDDDATGSTIRYAQDLPFQVEDRQLQTGEHLEVTFYAKDFRNIMGYQYSIEFDPGFLKFSQCKAEALANLSYQNFGFHMAEEGIITTSWDNYTGFSARNGTPLFTLSFNVIKSGSRLSDILRLTSGWTRSEAYAGNGSILEPTLAFVNNIDKAPYGVADDSFALYQNRPNPFKQETIIGFDLPEESPARLRIYDMSGRSIKELNVKGTQGYNEVKINMNEFPGGGVYYYQLNAGYHSAIRKMLRVKP